jgi:hypothetical protein
MTECNSLHDARPFRDCPLCDALRPRDDVWQLGHGVAPLVRDARESCAVPFSVLPDFRVSTHFIGDGRPKAR